ncbi:MAG TPA: glycosyltransferase [Chthoniobacteraceae bacterium]|jgi:GT2 family glycosyltransferase
MEISALIPCYNHAETITQTIASIRRQSASVRDLTVIDDGSTDPSVERATLAGARVVALGANLGRGAARARALAETNASLALMCDATLALPKDFIETAMRWFDEPRVAAVFGRVAPSQSRGVADRWRTRHLFKTTAPAAPDRSGLLATGACLFRTEAVRAVGGFDASLRHGEDADLGRRLLAAGWQVVSDPALRAEPLRRDSVVEVLERYTRWNSPEPMPWRHYPRQISYAAKVMAREDLRSGDPLAALLSMICPHYQFWRPRLRKIGRPS